MNKSQHHLQPNAKYQHEIQSQLEMQLALIIQSDCITHPNQETQCDTNNQVHELTGRKRERDGVTAKVLLHRYLQQRQSNHYSFFKVLIAKEFRTGGTWRGDEPIIFRDAFLWRPPSYADVRLCVGPVKFDTRGRTWRTEGLRL